MYIYLIIISMLTFHNDKTHLLHMMIHLPFIIDYIDMHVCV